MRFDEVSEGFTVELSNATNATIFDATGDGTINDEAVADVVTLSIVGPASIVEGESGTYTISVTVAPSSDLDVDIVTGHITTDNGDLTPVITTVTIPAGDTSVTLDIATNDDALADDGEQFTASINGTSRAEALKICKWAWAVSRRPLMIKLAVMPHRVQKTQRR